MECGIKVQDLRSEKDVPIDIEIYKRTGCI